MFENNWKYFSKKISKHQIFLDFSVFRATEKKMLKKKKKKISTPILLEKVRPHVKQGLFLCVWPKSKTEFSNAPLEDNWFPPAGEWVIPVQVTSVCFVFSGRYWSQCDELFVFCMFCSLQRSTMFYYFRSLVSFVFYH